MDLGWRPSGRTKQCTGLAPAPATGAPGRALGSRAMRHMRARWRPPVTGPAWVQVSGVWCLVVLGAQVRASRAQQSSNQRAPGGERASAITIIAITIITITIIGVIISGPREIWTHSAKGRAPTT